MMKIPKILFIAPLPPPITGQSVISRFIIKELSDEFDFIIINYSRKNLKPVSGFSFQQLFKSFKLSEIIKKNSQKIDLIYLTPSMSFFGNLKDLFFLFRSGRELRKKTIIHLHNGGFDEFYKKMFFIFRILNKCIFKEINKGIVLSDSLKKCLIPILSEEKIEVIPNFYDEKNLLDINKINKKWDNIKKFNLLFLSNFIKEKGFNEFLDGIISLPDQYQNKCSIVFAGSFYSKIEKNIFLKKISCFNNIKYLDFIEGDKKQKVLFDSHAFFLPTYYEIEAQPHSILESYAAGLAVFTTIQGGIKDIFIDKLNGKMLEKSSAVSVKEAIIDLIDNPDEYKKCALNNRNIIKNYSEEIFISNMKRIFQDVLSKT